MLRARERRALSVWGTKVSDSVHERRVGRLLNRQLVYCYKPPDGRHAGAVRIDFMGCDSRGRFWLVEAKMTSNQHYYSPGVTGSQGISPLQRAALSQVVDGARAPEVWVAVGKDNELFCYPWYSWRDIERWPFASAARHFTFRTWKKWEENVWAPINNYT